MVNLITISNMSIVTVYIDIFNVTLGVIFEFFQFSKFQRKLLLDL